MACDTLHPTSIGFVAIAMAIAVVVVTITYIRSVSVAYLIKDKKIENWKD